MPPQYWTQFIRKTPQSSRKSNAEQLDIYVFNSYSDRSPGCVTNMLTRLQWEPLADRRLNDSLTLLYKINNSIVNINKS